MSHGPLLARLILVAFILVNFCVPASANAPKRYHQGETQRGLASWYGADQGRQTASGERFDPNQLTAAHRNLPFGTIVRVTNRENGLSVDVRINDRGPWGDHNRIIDLSSAAADVLQMKRAGLVPVELEVIQLGSPSRMASGNGQ
jgi:rare lipoprotein A